MIRAHTHARTDGTSELSQLALHLLNVQFGQTPEKYAITGGVWESLLDGKETAWKLRFVSQHSNVVFIFGGEVPVNAGDPSPTQLFYVDLGECSLSFSLSLSLSFTPVCTYGMS